MPLSSTERKSVDKNSGEQSQDALRYEIGERVDRVMRIGYASMELQEIHVEEVVPSRSVLVGRDVGEN